jgi:hypothetical protein
MVVVERNNNIDDKLSETGLTRGSKKDKSTKLLGLGMNKILHT